MSTRPAGRERRRHRYALGAGGLLAALTLALALTAGGGSDDTTPAATEAAGAAPTGSRAVPSTTFEMLDGSPGSFATYRGRPLVVNFFASWCAPCLAELPGFERVHQDLEGRVAFLGLNLQDRPADGRGVVEETGITYDVGRDPDGELFRAFRGLAMPTTAFVDATGRIVDLHSGGLSAGALRDRIIDALLS